MKKYLNMYRQDSASLFGPGFDTFKKAQEWAQELNPGDTFVPTHGRDAGYHIELREDYVPIQKFDPLYQEGSEVTVKHIDRLLSSNISIATDESRVGNKVYYPHVHVGVDYEKKDT